MNVVEIKAMVDVSNADHINALHAFLLVIGSEPTRATTREVVENEGKIAESLAPCPTKKSIKAKEEPAKEEPAKEEPAKEEPVKEEQVKEEPVKEEPVGGVVEITQIREVLALKVNDHRATIKAKLTELGANNVSTLEAKHFDSFYAFLNELK